MFTPEELEVLRVALALYREYAIPRNISVEILNEIELKLSKVEEI